MDQAEVEGRREKEGGVVIVVVAPIARPRLLCVIVRGSMPRDPLLPRVLGIVLAPRSD